MKTQSMGRIMLLALVMLLLVAAPVSADPRVMLYRGSEAMPTDEGECYQAAEVTGDDLVSGCWLMTMEMAPLGKSGAFSVWGTATSDDLAFYPGQDGGGWSGTFRGLMMPNGDMIVNGTNVGWGELAGWRMAHHEMWRGGEASFWGHFLAPR